MQRNENKPEGNTWGAPAGKIDKDDQDKIHSLIREVREETGINISKYRINSVDKAYVRYSDYDFISNAYLVKLLKKPKIKINTNEHKDFCWISPKNALELNLIKDFNKSIKLFYKI